MSRIRGYQYVIFLIVVENPVISVILRTMTPYVKIKTQSFIFFNKRNKLEIEVTIGVKWTFQAVISAFLLSLLTHPTLAYINSTSSLYLFNFILFQISNQITMNKNRFFSPHNRHSYPSSMKEACHQRLSSPTCHESPTTQWKGIWSTYRTVAGPTPNFSTPSSFFLSIPVSFPEGHHLS